MNYRLISIALFAVLTATRAFAQDFDWDKYKSRTLKEITTRFAEASFKDPDVIIQNYKGG
jgi:hypothetical protein